MGIKTFAERWGGEDFGGDKARVAKVFGTLPHLGVDNGIGPVRNGIQLVSGERR